MARTDEGSPPVRAPRIPLNGGNGCRRRVIYIITSGEFVKIGISDDAKKRLQHILALNPHEVQLRLFRSLPGYLARECEKRIHQRLAAHHHRGEWFTASFDEAKAAVLDEIKMATRLFNADRVHWLEKGFVPFEMT